MANIVDCCIFDRYMLMVHYDFATLCGHINLSYIMIITSILEVELRHPIWAQLGIWMDVLFNLMKHSDSS